MSVAVLLTVPRAVAEHLQAGAVDDDMPRLGRRHVRRSIGELAAATAQSGVVRHREVETQQSQDAADEALGLSQGEAEHQTERQDQADREIGIMLLATGRGATLGVPAHERGLLNP